MQFLAKICKLTYKFWRTYDQQEIDLVEEREDNLFGYEFKWKPKPSLRAPKAWTKAYPNGLFQVITKENFLEFLLE